jgi:hypothetical protein
MFQMESIWLYLDSRLPTSVTLDASGEDLLVEIEDPDLIQTDTGAYDVSELVEAFGLPFHFSFDGNVLNLVVFRKHVSIREAQALPTPKIIEAINAVRRFDSATSRGVLGDYLEEAGLLAHAAYVRLEQALQVANTQDAEFPKWISQMRDLSALLPPSFRYLVGRDMQGCIGTRWLFRCPMQWNQMMETEVPGTRACSGCKQLVVSVQSEDEAIEAANSGQCVSFGGNEGEVEPDRVGEMAPENPNIVDVGYVGEVAAPVFRNVPVQGSVAVAMPRPKQPAKPIPVKHSH